MLIGCPKEIKTREYRVGLTPAAVREAVAHGHRVLVETGAPVPGEPSPSLDNLRTAGFEPVFTRKNYAAPGTTWTGLA